jgi:hypothetical protein
LFGEVFDVLEGGISRWSRVRSGHDGYEGWIHLEPGYTLDESSASIVKGCQPVILCRRMAGLKAEGTGEEIFVPGGCTLHTDPENMARIFAGKWFTLDSPVVPPAGNLAEKLGTLSGQFLNSPYLWGGRSAFGTDCSGLVQTLFRIMGTQLARDTGDQHKQGETVNLLAESRPGDLVFFDDEEGNIVHVGVLLDRERILHASGHVRMDPVDHQGIYNERAGSYSHRLRLIKRILNE